VNTTSKLFYAALASPITFTLPQLHAMDGFSPSTIR
jgi:hypothetical protein